MPASKFHTRFYLACFATLHASINFHASILSTKSLYISLGPTAHRPILGRIVRHMLLPHEDLSDPAESSDSTVHLVVQSVARALYWHRVEQRRILRVILVVVIVQLFALCVILYLLVSIHSH